jgi:arylsulfatase A-like enzyme
VRRSIGIITTLLLVIPVLADTDPPSLASTETDKGSIPSVRNLILFSIDTLRADRLGCYGYGRETSPAIDALARRGVLFEMAIAEASWTLPSHMTVLTGLYPTTHGAVDYSKRLPEGIQTLAEVLRERGFRTAAIVEGGYLNKRFGYSRGFDSWDRTNDSIHPVLQSARRFIEGLPEKGRFFLFLHTYGVHCPYDPPERYKALFVRDPKEARVLPAGLCGVRDFSTRELTSGQVGHLSDKYDGSVRAIDDEMGGFIAFLDGRKVLEDTALVILSDHGEEFMEHGSIGHEGRLHIEVLRVPLLVTAPGLTARKVQAGVGLVDVMPTVLDLLKVERPATQGRSLMPLMTGGEKELDARPLFSEHGEGPKIMSVVDGRYHLLAHSGDVEHSGAGGSELYDLVEDPAESKNLSDTHQAEVRRLLKLLDSHFSRIRRARAEYAREPTAEELEKLRSLGYVD